MHVNGMTLKQSYLNEYSIETGFSRKQNENQNYLTGIKHIKG